MSRADSPLLDKVIFVVGARRSGTNWLQRTIAAHPDVVAVPSETFLFSHGLRPLRERFHQGALGSTITGFVYSDLDTVLDRMRDLCDAVLGGIIRGIDPSAARIVERTPEHVRSLGLIGEVYPDAHIVHIVRDGRDVVRSLLSQTWGPDDVRAATLEWRSAISSARAEAPKLQHYHEVRYEDLLTDPTRGIVSLLEALELPVGEREMRLITAETGARYNIDPSAPSVEIGKWQSGLTPDAVAAIGELAGDVLAELGYDTPTASERPAAAPPDRRAPRPRLPRSRDRRKPPRSDERRRVETAYALDRFLGAAAAGGAGVGDLVAGSARIRIVDGDDRFEARGPEAVQRLVDAIASDAALRGRQVAGHVHPSLDMVTFVGVFESGERHHPRVVVLTVGDGGIDRVAYYRFPSGERAVGASER